MVSPNQSIQSERIILFISNVEVTNFCNPNKTETSHHISYIVLVKSKSLSLPTFKERYETRT